MRDATERPYPAGYIAYAKSVIMQSGARLAMVVPVVAGATLVILAGFAFCAHAQRPEAQTGGVDDMRPVYANAQDVAEGKRLAEATCAQCHGTSGVSTIAGVPNLAGQRSAYLYRELRGYQSGARGIDTMSGTVRFLGNDALTNVAAYYGGLDPAQPAPGGEVPATSDPVLAGKTVAAGCAGCHGESGVSKTAGMPSLIGQDPKYLVGAMTAYKTGLRKNDIMKAMMAVPDNAALNNVALYFALQKPARAQTPAAGDQAAGKAAAAACAGCHGSPGVSGNPATPSLAGQDAQYLVAALTEYKDGSRSDATMKGVAATINDTVFKDLAAFYATQTPAAPNVRKPLSTAEWVQRCDRCHGTNGNSNDPRLPALAGQRVEYLERVLLAYRGGTRKSPEMSAMSDALTEADIKNLAAYYAHQKPRAVVFVTVPPR
jgi:cytochrome c553